MAASLMFRALPLGCLAALALGGLPAQAQTPAWLAEATAQAQLSAGEVVMRSALGPGEASVEAAILVHATPLDSNTAHD